MNDFQVTIKQPVIITGNFEEMQLELQNMMKAYAGLEVTEANLPERKKDIATLRKIKDAIEDKRKAAKKDYEKPFKAFEAECKKLTGIIDKEIDRINDDMKVYEQKRIAEKRETVKRLYDENIGEFAEYLPLESIRKPQWDNKTYTEKDIIFDIQEAVIAVREDFRTIETMCEPWLTIMLTEDWVKLYLMARGKNNDTMRNDLASHQDARQYHDNGGIPEVRSDTTLRQDMGTQEEP